MTTTLNQPDREREALYEAAKAAWQRTFDLGDHSIRGCVTSIVDAVLERRTISDVELTDALTKCRDQFRFYASEHIAADKMEKAATNERYADLADNALNRAVPTIETALVAGFAIEDAWNNSGSDGRPNLLPPIVLSDHERWRLGAAALRSVRS